MSKKNHNTTLGKSLKEVLDYLNSKNVDTKIHKTKLVRKEINHGK